MTKETAWKKGEKGAGEEGAGEEGAGEGGWERRRCGEEAVATRYCGLRGLLEGAVGGGFDGLLSVAGFRLLRAHCVEAVKEEACVQSTRRVAYTLFEGAVGYHTKDETLTWNTWV